MVYSMPSSVLGTTCILTHLIFNILHKFFYFYLFFVFFFCKFIYFSWRLITLQYCGGFLPYIDMNQVWVYVSCPSWTPITHPSPSYPSGTSQCTSPEHLSHSLNLDWQSVSHMIIYMFQCYSLRSSHPCLLPQSPNDCFIHLCLFFCLAYRVIITILLNSIYMHQYTVLVFFFLAYSTLYNRLQFHPPH